jgi:hypothetical protein
VAVVALTVLNAGPALAATGSDGATLHQHGSWVETDDEDFCTGELIPIVTVTGNSVFHIGTAASGAASYTMAEEVNLSAVIDGLTYTGRLVFSGTYVQGQSRTASTIADTFRLTATDAAGTLHEEVGHEVRHLTWDSSTQSPVVTFDKATVSCT